MARKTLRKRRQAAGSRELMLLAVVQYERKPGLGYGSVRHGRRLSGGRDLRVST